MFWRVSIFTLMLSLSAQADWINEVYVPFDGAWNYKMSETGTPNQDHKNSLDFFTGMGLGIGYRGGVEFGPIGLGVDVQYGWKEESARRKPTDGSSAGTDYEFQTFRLMMGPYATYKVSDTFGFILEYSPIVTTTVHYSDGKSANPFRKNDELKGTAYAGGVMLWLDDTVSLTFLYRQRTYDDVETNGTSRDLPDSTYSKLKIDEFSAQLGFRF